MARKYQIVSFNEDDFNNLVNSFNIFQDSVITGNTLEKRIWNKKWGLLGHTEV